MTVQSHRGAHALLLSLMLVPSALHLSCGAAPSPAPRSTVQDPDAGPVVPAAEPVVVPAMADTSTAVTPDPEPASLEAQGIHDSFPASYWFEDSGGRYLEPTESSANKVIDAVAAKRAKISGCWTENAAADPGAAGTGGSPPSMSLLVTPGASWKIEVVSESLGDPLALKCISKAIKGILFPGILHLEDGTSMKKGWSLGLILVFPIVPVP